MDRTSVRLPRDLVENLQARRAMLDALNQLEASAGYQNAIRQALNQLHVAGVFEQIRVAEKVLASVVFPAQQIAAAFTHVQDLYAGLLRQVRFPDFEEWSRAEGQAISILATRGWWPHPEWSMAVVHEVIRLKSAGKIRQLDSMICSAYEANRARPMRKAMSRWMSLPEFRERKRILEDGFWAYRKGKYGLAVTHWLPQVEGVLRALAERNGLAQAAWKRVGKDTIASSDYMSPFTSAFWSALASLYGDSLPRGRCAARCQFPLQRDAVLHGVELRFGRRANAMRVFLMLDTLHYFISQCEKEEKSAA